MSEVEAEELRKEIVGIDTKVPLLDGGECTYINFDNAASTPSLKPVLDGVSAFLRWYASVHRGTGFKSKLSTWAYETAREKVLDFVGADARERVAIFVGNTTAAANKLARRLEWGNQDVVISTYMEHHSNDLPWRRVARVERVPLDEEGSPELDALEDLLRQHSGKVRLVALTGASNVTGLLLPVHDVAQIAHRYGAEVFVDAAQLAPHRRLKIEGDGRPDTHLDYVAFSAHKMYAPFGSGALIGWKSAFEDGEPVDVGGGTIRIVTRDEVRWGDPPEAEEAGSPNVVGAVALGLAIDWLERTGMEAIELHERRLALHAWSLLRNTPGVTVYGPGDPADFANRLAVFAFNLQNWHHAKLAAVLGYEFGIGVRNGCFCAHPYVKHLLGIGEKEEIALVERVSRDDRRAIPGAVRISLGFYNTTEEIDTFGRALQSIQRGECGSVEYEIVPNTGEYIPKSGELVFGDYLPFD